MSGNDTVVQENVYHQQLINTHDYAAMKLDDAVRSTLRHLMSPPRLLRTNISILQHGDLRMHNLALELCAERAGGLSVVELCPDGELIAGREVNCPPDMAELGIDALAYAMRTLWGREPDDAESLAGLASIRATSLLMAEGGVGGFQALMSWHCRVEGRSAHLTVWREAGSPVQCTQPLPAAASVRALIAALHEAACTAVDQHG
jgi:hypothetical protein